MVLAIISAVKANGRLKLGGAVGEYTSDSTGVLLALTCTTKKYPLNLVISDAFSKKGLII